MVGVTFLVVLTWMVLCIVQKKLLDIPANVLVLLGIVLGTKVLGSDGKVVGFKFGKHDAGVVKE